WQSGRRTRLSWRRITPGNPRRATRSWSWIAARRGSISRSAGSSPRTRRGWRCAIAPSRMTPASSRSVSCRCPTGWTGARCRWLSSSRTRWRGATRKPWCADRWCKSIAPACTASGARRAISTPRSVAKPVPSASSPAREVSTSSSPSPAGPRGCRSSPRSGMSCSALCVLVSIATPRPGSGFAREKI
ncbi:MAG: hypothetical protein AVDCRST_MAG18-1682, partial [uncultured Thermomicrobiales bacterium]